MKPDQVYCRTGQPFSPVALTRFITKDNARKQLFYVEPPKQCQCHSSNGTGMYFNQ